MTILQKNVGIRLKWLRENHFKLNQTNFAKLLGVKQTTLSKYETGENSFPDELKFILSEKGINSHWFLTGDGNMLVENSAPPPPLINELSGFINAQTAPKFADVDKRLSTIEGELNNLKKNIYYINTPKTGDETKDSPPVYNTASVDDAYDPPAEDLVELPLGENLAAGMPTESCDTCETYAVPRRLLKHAPDTYYVVKIAGTSMVEEGIPDGAHVLIERTSTPTDGSVMVVRYKNKTTLKLLARTDDGGWELRYEDGSNRKIILYRGEWEVRGKFITVLT